VSLPNNVLFFDYASQKNSNLNKINFVVAVVFVLIFFITDFFFRISSSLVVVTFDIVMFSLFPHEGIYI
jgi:hypothetical protein